MSITNDFRLQFVAPKYRKALVDIAQKISNALNSQMTSYEENISALRGLINSGTVLTNHAQTLNKSLVRELKLLRSKEGDLFQHAPISIQSLSASQANRLLEDLQGFLATNDPEDYFTEFENKMVGLFFKEGMNNSLSQDCLIQFKSHTNSQNGDFDIQDMNYDGLVEAYLSNYAKLLSGDTNLEWDRNILSDYIMFLENKIYKINDDIGDKIKDIVISNICAPVLNYRKTPVTADLVKTLNYQTETIINKLVQEKNNYFEQLINNYKARVVESANQLFEKINLEQFPNAVSHYIEKQKQEDEQFFETVLNQTKELDYERDLIEAELSERGLKHFHLYDKFDNALGENADLIFSRFKAQMEFDTLFKNALSPLDIFMSERNEYGDDLKAQFDKDDGKYRLLIDEINCFKSSDQLIKNKVNLAILNSLESLAIDLKNRYLNTLSILFFDFAESTEMHSLHKEFVESTSIVEQFTKEFITRQMQELQKSILSGLVSGHFDDFNRTLPDELIVSSVKQWLKDNETNPKWKKFNLTSPDAAELSALVDKLFKTASKDFFAEIEETTSASLDSVPVQGSVMNFLKKLCTIPLDAAKAVAVVSSGGTLATALFSHEKKALPQMCENTWQSAIEELKTELDQKKQEALQEEIKSKALESVEGTKTLIELWEKNSDSTIQKLAALAKQKLSQRYNPFDNKDLIIENVSKQIIDLRNNRAKAMHTELHNAIQGKMKEMESLQLADELVNDILES